MVNSVSSQQQLQQQQLQEQQLQEQLEQQLQTQAQQFDVNVAAAVLDVSEQMVNHQQHQLDQSEEQHVVAMHDDDVIGGDEVVSQDDNGQGDERDERPTSRDSPDTITSSFATSLDVVTSSLS